MNSRISGKLQFVNAALVAAMSAGSAFAADLPKEGSYDFTACHSGAFNIVAFSKTHFGYNFEGTGTIRSNSPDGFMDKLSFRCVGLNTTFDTKKTSESICEVVDRQGDKQLARVSLGSDGKTTREVLSGTGKFEGLQMNGTVTDLGPFPTIKPGTYQSCNRQTGTYKMK